MVNYKIVNCQLGALLVAATDKGVCSVKLGDDAAKLEEELAKEFGANNIESVQNDDLDFWAGKLAAYSDGVLEWPNIPCDIKGSDFQMKVWDFLRKIPSGETYTYSDVAHAIGKPKAFRAVANACGQNPVALAIPCHRVVQKGGKISGYNWGVERKRKLLDNEAA